MKKSEFDFIRSLDALCESKLYYLALNDRHLTIERGIALMAEGPLKEDCKNLLVRLKRGLTMIGNALSTLKDRFEDNLVEAVEWENDEEEENDEVNDDLDWYDDENKGENEE